MAKYCPFCEYIWCMQFLLVCLYKSTESCCCHSGIDGDMGITKFYDKAFLCDG